MRLSQLILWCVALLAHVDATCYRPDGSAMDSYYMPCNGSTEASMCCHLGFTNNGGDLCGEGSKYGLCGVTGTQLWRESCTDPTWQSPYCLKLCIDGDYKGDDAKITQCNDGSFCCGANNSTCCAEKGGLFIVNNQVTTALPASSATSPSSIIPSTSAEATTAPTAAATASSTQTPASTNPASGSGTSKTTIGIAVGVSIAAFSLIGVLFLYIIHRKHRRRNQPAEESRSVEAPPTERSELQGEYYMPKELDQNQNPLEIDTPGLKPPGSFDRDYSRRAELP